ncbi:hypothetical protein [Roseateles violae]|uniref:Superfamily III holin-X n=1 Tax=Roseateles violae TaxID=3058042 RepID=A0ABT8DQM6_9BURK|nr:hypothetical protein [Pelomonas sp. PFR6]MDN3920651.1 hypothetical protein [Pelomonas sp. PFR6]
MIHPLFTTLATRPQLLVEHLGAYAQLAAAEAGESAALLRRRLTLLAVAALSGLLGLALGGVALLLLAVVPTEQMPHGWLLIAVPALPLLLALSCGLQLGRQARTPAFELLRHQLSQDAALLREAGER